MSKKYKDYEIYHWESFFHHGLGFLVGENILYLDAMAYSEVVNPDKSTGLLGGLKTIPNKPLYFFLNKESLDCNSKKFDFNDKMLWERQRPLIDKAISLYEKDGIPTDDAFMKAFNKTKK